VALGYHQVSKLPLAERQHDTSSRYLRERLSALPGYQIRQGAFLPFFFAVAASAPRIAHALATYSSAVVTAPDSELLGASGARAFILPSPPAQPTQRPPLRTIVVHPDRLQRGLTGRHLQLSLISRLIFHLPPISQPTTLFFRTSFGPSRLWTSVPWNFALIQPPHGLPISPPGP